MVSSCPAASSGCDCNDKIRTGTVDVSCSSVRPPCRPPRSGQDRFRIHVGLWRHCIETLSIFRSGLFAEPPHDSGWPNQASALVCFVTCENEGTSSSTSFVSFRGVCDAKCLKCLLELKGKPPKVPVRPAAQFLSQVRFSHSLQPVLTEDLCRTEPVGMKHLHNGRITACCGVHPADVVSNEASGPERRHVGYQYGC